jgi:hypothetical protein
MPEPNFFKYFGRKKEKWFLKTAKVAHFFLFLPEVQKKAWLWT